MIKFNGTVMPIWWLIMAAVVGSIVGLVIKYYGPSILSRFVDKSEARHPSQQGPPMVNCPNGHPCNQYVTTCRVCGSAVKPSIDNAKKEAS